MAARRPRKRTAVRKVVDNSSNSRSSNKRQKVEMTANQRQQQRQRPLLGLQRIGINDVEDASSSAHPIYELAVGNILGRKPSKPAKRASHTSDVNPIRHVHIGITDVHVPRKFLQVSKVSSSTLELRVYLEGGGGNQPPSEKAQKAHRKNTKLLPDVCKIVRHGRSIPVKQQQDPPDQPIVLHANDVFQVENISRKCNFSYHYRVVPIPFAPFNQNATAQPSEQSTRNDNNDNRKTQSQQHEDKREAAKQTTLQRELDDLEQTLGFRPYRPTRPMGYRHSSIQSSDTMGKAKPTSTKTQTMIATTANFTNITNTKTNTNTKNQKKAIHSSPTKNAMSSQQESDSDDDDDDDAIDPVRQSTMHATLGNQYSKALNTSTPHFGTSFLHLIRSKNQHPTPQLLQELVQLLTFGPMYQANDYFAFWEGNRLQLATQYVQELLVQPCMGPRFKEAIHAVAGDVDYWQLLLDQLTVLAYNAQSRMGPNHDETPEQAQHLRLVRSLELHAVSLQFFLLLLQYPGTGMLRQVQLNSKDVTRRLAQIMALVWVERGHYLLGEENLEIATAVEQITRHLTQILGYAICFDQQSINSNSSRSGSRKKQPHRHLQRQQQLQQDLVTTLWSAMDERFQQTDNENVRAEKKRLILFWICNLEDLIPREERWETITQGLIQRAGLYKVYNTISKV